jgi:hypothetical protein
MLPEPYLRGRCGPARCAGARLASPTGWENETSFALPVHSRNYRDREIERQDRAVWARLHKIARDSDLAVNYMRIIC